MAEHMLCRLDEIDDGGSAGFEIGRTLILAVRRGETVRAYVNSCPHVGTPLDMWPGRFLTKDGKYILCATHGALFEIDDGKCVAGPCVGQGLTPVETRLGDGLVKVLL
jgi:nitrite reductase/ring-hydroxylating ferredoxin subunit